MGKLGAIMEEGGLLQYTRNYLEYLKKHEHTVMLRQSQVLFPLCYRRQINVSEYV